MKQIKCLDCKRYKNYTVFIGWQKGTKYKTCTHCRYKIYKQKKLWIKGLKKDTNEETSIY